MPALLRLPVLGLKSWLVAVSLLTGIPVLVALVYSWSHPGTAPALVLSRCAAGLAIGWVAALALGRALDKELRGEIATPSGGESCRVREFAALATRHRMATRTLRQVHGTQLQAEEAERRRLARELHDELGQELAMLHMWLQAVRADEGPGRAPHPHVLDDCKSIAGALMERVRSMALDLRPAQLDDLGLPAALAALARRAGRQTGITVTLLDMPQHAQRFPDCIETALFRIAQAAVTNTVRHAGASTLWISFRVHEGEATVKVRDDGSGFDVQRARARIAAATGMGLLVMQERVKTLGGSMEIDSAPGRGTSVSASLPLALESAA